MLNIKKDESENMFNICGVLNSIKVSTGKSAKKNDEYVKAEIEIRVDQDFNDKKEQNIIPLTLFSMRHKADKTLNQNFDRIKDYGENLIALGSVEKGKENFASKVNITAKIKENTFVSKTGQTITSWNLDTNFINNWRAADEEGTRFVVTGVVGKVFRETDKNGDETGKLNIRLGLVGYNGRVDLIDFCAYGSKADYIEEHWHKGDTIKCAGFIRYSTEVIEVEEDMGFGDPITKKTTVPVKELVIDRGSRDGLDDAHSYDADDIKAALAERTAYIAKLEEDARSKPKAKPAASDDFGGF